MLARISAEKYCPNFLVKMEIIPHGLIVYYATSEHKQQWQFLFPERTSFKRVTINLHKGTHLAAGIVTPSRHAFEAANTGH